MFALLMPLVAILLVAGAALAQPAPDTLTAVRARGALLCGVTPNTVGFAAPDSRGEWHGLDADYCRAVATAALGDPTKVRFVPTTAQNRFVALQSGEVDMLSRATTWTLAREAQLGLEFAGVNYYDGNAFLVHRNLGVDSATKLDGATVCLQPGSTTELNVGDYFRQHTMRLQPVLIENLEELRSAFASGRCDAYASDTSTLAAFRLGQGEAGQNYVLLPEVFSKEPLGPAVRKGDWRWFDLVRWTHFALLNAEEMGINATNAASFSGNAPPDIQRFTGRSGDLGKMLGVENDWALRVVRAVGNFGEIWERNITPTGMPRGVNKLWTQGGLMYAPPMR